MVTEAGDSETTEDLGIEISEVVEETDHSEDTAGMTAEKETEDSEDSAEMTAEKEVSEMIVEMTAETGCQEGAHSREVVQNRWEEISTDKRTDQECRCLNLLVEEVTKLRDLQVKDLMANEQNDCVSLALTCKEIRLLELVCL